MAVGHHVWAPLAAPPSAGPPRRSPCPGRAPLMPTSPMGAPAGGRRRFHPGVDDHLRHCLVPCWLGLSSARTDSREAHLAPPSFCSTTTRLLLPCCHQRVSAILSL